MSLLNLSDADMGGFEALDPGRYNAEVFDITWDAVKNPGGRTPVGTPMIKVEFKLTDEDAAVVMHGRSSSCLRRITIRRRLRR